MYYLFAQPNIFTLHCVLRGWIKGKIKASHNVRYELKGITVYTLQHILAESF